MGSRDVLKEIHETCLNHIRGDKYISVCSDEEKWVNRILKLHEQYPDEVKIEKTPEENHGMIIAEMPYSYFKLNHPRRVNYTEEQLNAIVNNLNKNKK